MISLLIRCTSASCQISLGLEHAPTPSHCLVPVTSCIVLGQRASALVLGKCHKVLTTATEMSQSFSSCIDSLKQHEQVGWRSLDSLLLKRLEQQIGSRPQSFFSKRKFYKTYFWWFRKSCVGKVLKPATMRGLKICCRKL